MSDCCSGASGVIVEVEYLVVDGQTCERCGDTRGAARQAVADARSVLAPAGLTIELVERELSGDRLADSNRVLVNGVAAEGWLGGSSSMSDCPSCADLLGASACCREVEVGGARSEGVPREVVYDAIMAAAGLAPAGVPGQACCGGESDAAEPCCGSADAAAGTLAVTIVVGAGCG
jgi:hypothetical protein